MPASKKFADLHYAVTVNAQEFTTKPGALDAGRLAQGKTNCWTKLSAAKEICKKNIILADWWAESWDPLMRSQVQVLFVELLGEGFKIYVWHASELKLFNTIELLYDIPWCKQIAPEFKAVLTQHAMDKLRLSSDQLAILQRVELEKLLGRTVDESRTISAHYLLKTTQNIAKIKAVEASESSTFDNAVFRELSTAEDGLFSQIIQGMKDKIKENWGELKFIEQVQVLDLSQNCKVYLQENGHVAIDKFKQTYGFGNYGIHDDLKEGHERSDKLVNQGAYELTPSPVYLSLDLKATDDLTTAEAIQRLLTLSLQGLSLTNYSYPIDPTNLANLKYLTLDQSCPPDIGLAIIKASRLHRLDIDMREYKIPDGPEADAALDAGFGESLSELKCLTLVSCDSKKLEFMLQHPMPELYSLDLNANLLHEPFAPPLQPLDKLQSIVLSGDWNARCFEVLMQSAKNCEQLNLKGISFTEEFSPDFRLPKVTSLVMGNLSSPTEKYAARMIFKSAPLLSIIEIDGSISSLTSIDDLAIPSLECLRLSSSGVISAQTLSPFLSSISELNELEMRLGPQDQDTFIWNEELFAIFRKIRKMQLSLSSNEAVMAIDKVGDIPSLESIELDGLSFHKEQLINGIDKLFQSSSDLKSLTIHDFISDFDFIHKVSLPQTVESLVLCGRSIPAENLKTMLLAMSKLSYLKIDGEDRYKERNFEEWQEDEELQSLLAGIKTVIFPHAYHKTVEDSVEYARDRAGLVSGGRSSGGLDMTRSGGASSISPQRDPSQASAVDGDTTPNPNKTFDLARIFYATHGHHHPHPADYRLSTYNHVKLSEQRGIEAPFILENEGDLALVARTFSVVDDVKCLRQEHTLGGFFGTQTFNLDEAWQAIASLTPRDEITHVTASSTDYEIMYSNRDNLYYIQSTNGRQTFTLDFLLRTRALATPAITNPEIDTLIKKFKGFELGTLTLASTNPTPQE